MSAFITKTDYYNLADGDMLVCVSSEDGKAAELAEAQGEDGSIVAHNVYGESIAPTNTYAMKATTFEKDEGDIKLGACTSVSVGTSTKSICLNGFTISTSAGSAPSIEASGEQVEDGAATATDNCTYSIPAITLQKKHHAFILMNAFSYNKVDSVTELPTGVHLQSANYNCSGSITKATKDGVCLTHDITEGKIECEVEFVQTGSVEPKITAGTGWVITSPLTQSNPDADYPTWSATLTMYLAKD